MSKSGDINPKLQVYIDALHGKGDRAADWQDKPHRLIYDLVKLAQSMDTRIESAKVVLTDEDMENHTKLALVFMILSHTE